MGLCGSAAHDEGAPEDRAKSRNLDRQIGKDAEREGKILKLLLLGAGESGKSTLFKQCNTIYGKGFTDGQKLDYKLGIYKNIIQSMRELITQSAKYGEISKENDEARRVIADCGDNSIVDERVAAAVTALWADFAIQSAFNHRAEFDMIDSASYFFEKVREVANTNYMPSVADILRVRVRTTGIVESEFSIETTKFKMFDVGGQKSERKKWIHCFEGVESLLYVTALSEYDQVLFEDGKTNRMRDSLDLWEKTVNLKWFAESSIILFLNKRDLFQEKIARVPLTVCFKSYTGKSNYEDGTDYIERRFTEALKDKKKQIYVHITCATDTDNIRRVFNSVNDNILRQALKGASILQ